MSRSSHELREKHLRLAEKYMKQADQVCETYGPHSQRMVPLAQLSQAHTALATFYIERVRRG